jgi:hypothetical protein
LLILIINKRRRPAFKDVRPWAFGCVKLFKMFSFHIKSSRIAQKKTIKKVRQNSNKAKI